MNQKLLLYADFVEQLIYEVEKENYKKILLDLAADLRHTSDKLMRVADAIEPFAAFEKSGYELNTPNFYQQSYDFPLLQSYGTESVKKYHLKHLTQVYGEII